MEGVRGLNRTATLGSLDTKLEKRKKRALHDQQAYEARKIKASTSARVHVECYEESEVDDKTYLPAPKRKMRKKESLPEVAYLVADVAGVSNRTLTQLAAANIKHDGKDLNDYHLSVKTIERRRKLTRTVKAKEILERQLGHSNDAHLHYIGMAKL